MKRYKKLSTTLPDLQSKPYTVIVVDNEMCEDPEGEWVRFEDIFCNGCFDPNCTGIKPGFRKRIGNDPKTHLQPGIKMPECNCHKYVTEKNGNMYFYQSHGWIFPAHGYKKR